MISIRGLHRSYVAGGKQVHALRGIDVDLEAGSVTALYGKSGSGKTTLLNCVGSLDKPNRGTIDVNGTEVTALGAEQATTWRRTNLGFVYQSHGLMPWLTAEQNVELPLRMIGVRRRERRDRARVELERVGLAEWADHLPDELSGGQQQRVGVARATVTRPMVLLADEPTGALDEATGRGILTLFAQTARETGCTVLIATHDSATAEIADHVVELVDGMVTGRSDD